MDIDAVNYITISYREGDKNELAFFNSAARLESEKDKLDRAIAELLVEVVQALLQIAQQQNDDKEGVK